MGWIFYGIGILIFASIIEQVLYRGIIVQKLAIEKSIVKAAIISAILFAIMHFRYDVIPLFITGIIYVVLYFKTNGDRSIPMTIAEYQQQFIDPFEWSN